MNSPFVDAVNWRENWAEHQKLKGGGQGDALAVTSRETRELAFCKVLRAQGDLERRTRFSLESAAYLSYDHPNLPKLIQSNAHLHKDLRFKLYMVLELIPGGSLASNLKEPAKLECAVLCVTSLLETLTYIHRQGGVHRDIKPENIIARDGDIRLPVLVDLGLHFSQREEGVHETEHGQELGNRFLRLPELAAGSLAKQDPASDVAFAAGILFFVLTGERPFTLLDSEGRMPHQRPDASALLRSDEARPLLRVFDRAFQYRVEDRFRSASELSEAVNSAVHGRDSTVGVEDRDVLGSIRSDLDSAHYQRDAAIQGNCDAIIREAHREMESIAEHLSDRYVRTQTGHSTFKTGCRTKVGLALRNDHANHFYLAVEAAVVGAEVVITVDDEEVTRAQADKLDLPEIRTSLRTRFLTAVELFHARNPASGI